MAQIYGETLLGFKDSFVLGVPMLRIVLALFLFFLLPYQAHADLESAMAAYEAGDYETAVKEL